MKDSLHRNTHTTPHHTTPQYEATQHSWSPGLCAVRTPLQVGVSYAGSVRAPTVASNERNVRLGQSFGAVTIYYYRDRNLLRRRPRPRPTAATTMTMMRRRARFFFVAISALLIDSLFCNGIKAFGIGRSRSRFRSRSHATRSERSSLVSNGEVDNRNVVRNNGDSNNNNENAVSVAPEDRRSRSPRRQHHRPPTVVICGGGPSGLLAAILLDSIGIPSTVVERASETSGWGAKSYVMVLDEKGQGALARAGEGCLEAAIECGHLRRFTGFVNASDGSVRRVPRKGSPGLAITRDGLVRCLERIAEERPGVTVTRGIGVSGIVFAGDRDNDNDSDSDRENDDDNGLLWVELNDGSRIPATHVIGADGKWSNVRRTVPSFSSTLVTCPSAAIVMTLDSIPEGWDPDGNYVIQPERSSSSSDENENDNDNDTDFYCIALAIPNTQRVSLAMIYFDSMLEKHPWLAPPDGDESDDGNGNGNESDDVDDDDDRSPPDPLPDRLERLLEEHVPALAALLDDRAYETATRKRRVTWLRMEAHAPNGADDDDDDPFVSYSSGDGRISLIGDAAHAMTASTGQGCNTALESAVKLFDHLVGTMRESESEIDTQREEGDEDEEREERETDASRGANCTREIMSRAFVRYGTSRPEECIAVQEKSVSASSGRPRR